MKSQKARKPVVALPAAGIGLGTCLKMGHGYLPRVCTRHPVLDSFKSFEESMC
jgi:hypothetical protein